jgi:amino-acid N-acetyltransferase
VRDYSQRAASAADLPVVVALLEQAGLPTADLVAGHLLLAIETSAADEPACGFIGLEHFSDHALLRSLIVDPAHRDAGLGSLLVEGLEQQAIAMGVVELWLLTIDAERWFSRHAYRVRERSAAPQSIQSSREFASLCPGDAVLMSKRLSA